MPARSENLRLRDLLLLLAAVALPMTVALLLYLNGERRERSAEWVSRLEAYAEARVSAVDSWLAERHADAQVLAANASLANLCRVKTARGGAAAPPAQDLLAVQDELGRWVRHTHLVGAHLFTPAGDSLLRSQAPGAPGPRSVLAVQRAAREGRPLLDGIYIGAEGGQRIGFLAPVLGPAARGGEQAAAQVLGVVGLYLDPRNTLYPLLGDLFFADVDIHCYLVKREGDAVRILSPVPSGVGATAAVVRAGAGLVEAAAVSAAPVSGWFHNYRGDRVLGAVRRVPGTDWGLVVTATQARVLAEWLTLARWSSALTTVVFVCIALGGVIAWRSWAGRRYRALVEALASRERRLEALTSGTDDLVFITDVQGRFVLANPATRAALGGEGDVLGKRMRDFLAAEAAAPMEDHDRLVLERGALYRGEEVFPTAGTEQVYSAVRLPIRSEDGVVEAVAGILRDITPRIANERELEREVQQRRRAERRVRRLHDATAAATGAALFSAVVEALAEELGSRWVFLNETTSGETVHVLAAMEDGLPAEFAPFPLHATPCEETLLARCFTSFPEGVGERLPEGSYLRSRGAEAYAGMPILSSRGDPLGVLCLFDDVAIPLGDAERDLLDLFAQRIAGELERAQAERTIARTRRALETMVQNLPGAAYRCRCSSRREVHYVSAGVCLATGHAEQVFAGDAALSLEDLLVAEDRPRVWREIEQAVVENRPYEVSYRIHDAEGEMRWMSDIGRAVAEDGGELLLEGVIFDQTERYQLEVQLAHGQRMEALGRLAGGVAHDFNNLLTAISGYAEMVLRHGDAPQVEKSARGILATTDRAAELTRQLLAFSRNEIAEPKEVSLRESVQGALEVLTRIIGEDVDLEAVLGDDSSCVHADPAKLEQVLVNLVVNARDAMPEGGKIWVRTYRADASEAPAATVQQPIGAGYAVLEVEDTGVGIAEEVRERIFEPFFTTREGRGGTGLGLSTVYGIVSQAQGTIVVDSSVGRGTVMRVYWPALEQDKASPEGVDGPPTEAAAPALTLASDILLVDDDTAIAELTTKYLEDRSYAVRPFPSGTAVLAQLAELERPDLLITDVRMQGVGGVALAERLRRHWPGLPVIYISGYAAGMPVLEDAAAPAMFLAKPFRLADLERHVREILTPGAGLVN